MAVLSIALCSIVESFEAIAENLVNQENFTRIEVVGDDVTLVGERVGGFSVFTTSPADCVTSSCILIYTTLYF